MYNGTLQVWNNKELVSETNVVFTDRIEAERFIRKIHEYEAYIDFEDDNEDGETYERQIYIDLKDHLQFRLIP
jgi:hypothetical protein